MQDVDVKLLVFSFCLEGRLRTEIPALGLTEVLPGAYLLLKRVTRSRQSYLQRRNCLLDEGCSVHSFLDFFLLHGRDVKLIIEPWEDSFDRLKKLSLSQGAISVFRKKSSEPEMLFYYAVGSPSHQKMA
jgi:hypothetical protein